MGNRFRETYQSDDGLEQAIVDLVRVGSTGHVSGVRQLATRLMRAVPPAVRDEDRFRTEIHDALRDGAKQEGLRFASGELPVAEDGGLPLAHVDPAPDGSALVLPERLRLELDEIVLERARSADLARAGVCLTRTVLMSGPPGVGKTMAAQWLASAIGVPLVTLDLSAVSSSFLGNSGRNVRAVMDYAKTAPCLLLLDEFDALAKRREDETDIGELKRVVNVVLMELDRWPETSLLVAATNHPQLLDPAVGRRFDRSLCLPLPGPEERCQILSSLAEGSDVTDKRLISLVADVTDGMSGSDLTRLWNAARRRHILAGQDTAEELLAQTVWGFHESGPTRDEAWLAVAERLELSNRQIAAKAGVTHPTVSSALERARSRRGSE